MQPEAAQLIVGLGALDIEEGPLAELFAGVGVIIDVVVRYQRVEPVDGRKILGQAVRGAMMIGPCLGNPGRRVDVDGPDPGWSASRWRAGRSSWR